MKDVFVVFLQTYDDVNVALITKSQKKHIKWLIKLPMQDKAFLEL